MHCCDYIIHFYNFHKFLSVRILFIYEWLTLAPTQQNGQTHSNELFECVWPFYGAGA